MNGLKNGIPGVQPDKHLRAEPCPEVFWGTYGAPVGGKCEATEKGIYYTSLRESTLHNNPPEFSYSDERSTLRRMFAF